ncbi:threonylcarbamoyl-AMP synthase [Collinsella sp. AGMB00827]|uniref:L-threonylcarbamoyladenylate synthase n=1 Tax=Collinsella ureilytica TaxID=2869515 RepID=A0ABS7MJQ0_9ACTN|nr:L-threonylcarbamoyladenylate synthase [Collinsella urealyticum]MBY4797595.1 threonylcarbamoyl-AMP synthase [Collinsella urealyticum]
MRRIYRIGSDDHPAHHDSISYAACDIERGALALLPTETVYGIGVSVAAAAASMQEQHRMVPVRESGYERIFSLKQRDRTQTVPWLVAGVQALDTYGSEVDPRARALATELWPGALTIVVQATDQVPSFLQAADGTVALRASASPAIQALIARVHAPLAVTSANTHGAPAPTSFANVESRILSGVDVAIDAGATGSDEASTIVSFTSGSLEILRIGAISPKKILSIVHALPSVGSDGSLPVSERGWQKP